jgi:hypothetical protein
LFWFIYWKLEMWPVMRTTILMYYSYLHFTYFWLAVLFSCLHCWILVSLLYPSTHRRTLCFRDVKATLLFKQNHSSHSVNLARKHIHLHRQNQWNAYPEVKEAFLH